MRERKDVTYGAGQIQMQLLDIRNRFITIKYFVTIIRKKIAINDKYSIFA